jgi:DNA gyrase/topoisomerase IV subunit A
VRDGVAARILVDAGFDAVSLRGLVATPAWGGAGERARPMTPEYREVLEERLALVEAQLMAFEHRADIVDAVADAPSRPDAETVIAKRLKLTLRQPQAVLAVRLGQWTSDEVRAMRQELGDLRARVEAHDT